MTATGHEMSRMRAAVIARPGSAVIQRDVPPLPGRGEVRIRLEGCGVCGSNLPVWEGRPWFAYPFPRGAPGHEGWGTVDAIGDGVPGGTLGTRVACLSSHAFAEYDVASADAIVTLPPALDGVPMPAEALACAINVCLRAAIGPGTLVAVVGVGFLGALVTRLASRAGARVVCASRRLFARESALRMGAAAAVAMTDLDATVRRVLDETGGTPCDVAIEATGTQPGLDLASALVGVRGRLVIAGYHQDGLRQVDMQSWNWRGLDVINAHERDPQAYVSGMREAVALVADGTLDPSPLYTHALGLDELPRAFELLRERPEGFMKALVQS